MSNTTKKFRQVRTDGTLIARIVQAGLEGKHHDLETAALTLVRLLRSTDPAEAKKISDVLGYYAVGSSPARGLGISQAPTDSDSKMEMATIIPPSNNSPIPVLNNALDDKVKNFLRERQNANQLTEAGLTPSSSLLFVGPPGTGKTMLAHYIASKLNKPLVILDLATSVSSFLGKTGQNLKKVLTFAKNEGAVLLLDEFDAIAKRRDDNSDLGELKRVVNILLVELESWPSSSVLIATSNHPKLLDPAIWRRFDDVLYFDLPSLNQIESILVNKIENLNNNKDLKKIFIHGLDGESTAEVSRFADKLHRRMLLNQQNIKEAGLTLLGEYISQRDKKIKKDFFINFKKILGNRISVRKISELTGVPKSTIQSYL